MCNVEKYLVAWMDAELEESEAASVGQHVETCSTCRERLSALRAASNSFASYYAGSVPESVRATARPTVMRWVTIAAAVAAAILIGMILLPRTRRQAPVRQEIAEAPPAVAVRTAPAEAAFVPRPPVAAKRRTPPRRNPRPINQPPEQATVQIVIPASAMFPPGAMPEGVAYIANLNYAIDGAVPGYRLQQ